MMYFDESRVFYRKLQLARVLALDMNLVRAVRKYYLTTEDGEDAEKPY
jgi:hypothetical protein